MKSLPKQIEESVLRQVLKRLHYPLGVMLLCVRWYAALLHKSTFPHQSVQSGMILSDFIRQDPDAIQI